MDAPPPVSEQASSATFGAAAPVPDPPARLVFPRTTALDVVLVAVVSFLLHPSWPGIRPALSFPGQWSPGLGIVLVLAIRRGAWASLLLIPAAGLASIGIAMRGIDPAISLVDALLDGGIQSVLVFTIHRLYRRHLNGEADLGDPRSATSFFVVCTVVVAVGSFCRNLVLPSFDLGRIDQFEEPAYWGLMQLLGIAALAPPLLVFLPPRTQTGTGDASNPFPRQRLGRLQRGDLIEIVLLAIATGLMSLLLTATTRSQDAGRWQLWGAPLLLVVWAGIRQRRQGATIVAGTSVAASMLLLPFLDEQPAVLLIQANLIAQCATALLVSSSVDWVRGNEERYSKVVGQIPVVLYSTRVTPGEPQRIEITFVNPPCRTILGRPPEQILGDHSNWMNLVHPEDREILRAALRQLGRQDQPVVCEYRLAPKPGESPDSTIPQHSPLPEQRTRWVRDVLVPHFDSTGALEGWEGMASDITEQRVLADDLRRTTSMFHTLVANLPAGVFFVSARSGRPILVNQRARQLLGRREDASAGIEHLSTVYRLHRPDGTPYPVEELPPAQVLRRGVVSMRDDIVVHRPDGRRVPLISWAAPVDLARNGKGDAVVWVLEDLTELRQAEAARRETEAALRTVIESLAEVLLVQDRHESVVDSNPAAGLLLGELLETPNRIPDAGWLKEDGSPLEPDDHPIRRVLRTGQPVRNVVLGLPRGERVERDPGSSGYLRPPRPRWLLINSLPLAPKPGTTPAGVVSTLVDITDHIQAEQRVRDSEERYRSLVDALPLMVLQFDRDMTLTLANPAMLEISGYRLDEVSSPGVWTTLVHPEDFPRVAEGFQEALAGKSVRCECRYRAKDQQERFCYCFIQPIWSSDESPSRLDSPPEDRADERVVVGITSVVLDLTRERRLENELQRSQRLELVGRLSSSIAHDFNNLLTALLGLTQLAQLKSVGGEPVREELQQIAEVGDQATQLTQQILSFCKQRPIPTARVDANRAVRRIADILRNLLPRTIRLVSEIHPAPIHVLADEIQLQQVVMNLCLNARDAMPQGGVLVVRTKVIVEDGPPAACLSVEDTGIGMTPELRGRIFEAFFSTKERGTGLGLAVVHQVVTSFGGEVRVHSEPGRGSRFEVRLPLHDT